MLYLVTILSVVGFVLSFINDKRKLSNAFLFLLALGLLFLSLTKWVYDHEVEGLYQSILLFVYGLLPLGLLIFACYMIANGFVILKKEGKRLANSLSILFGLGLLAYMVLSLLYLFFFGSLYRQNPVLANWLNPPYVVLTFVVLVLSFIFLAFLIYSVLYLSLPKQKDYDFIIIHGSGLIDGHIVPPLLASRIDKAIEAYQLATKNDVCFIASGGQGADELVSEARAIADYLLDKGIPKDRIIIEDKSTTTYENLAYSHALAKERKDKPKYLFVTNNYHVFRTSLYAKRLGMTGEGLGAKTAGYYIPSAFLREYIAILNKLKWILVVLALAFLALLYLSK